jgi:hypothetical protein
MNPIFELVKAAHKSLAAHFGKMAAHSEAVAAHHDAQDGVHTEMAEAHKAIAGCHKAAEAEELHGEHMKLHKAHVTKAGHHAKMCKAFGKFGEHCKAMGAAHEGAEKAVKADVNEGDLQKTLAEGIEQIRTMVEPVTGDVLKATIRMVVEDVVKSQIEPNLTKIAGMELVGRDGKTLDATKAVRADTIDL